MSYMQTILDDNNRDRVYDISVRKFVTTNATGKINYQVIETDAGNDGVIDTRTTNHFGYDDLGRQNWQWDTTDNYADGTWDSESYRHIEYDAYAGCSQIVWRVPTWMAITLPTTAKP